MSGDEVRDVVIVVVGACVFHAVLAVAAENALHCGVHAHGISIGRGHAGRNVCGC